MSRLLYFSTIGLCIAGIVFSLVYIWLNAFSKITDLGSRNTSLLKILRASMWLSVLFSLLTCLFSNTGDVAEAISDASRLYSFIAVSWLVVILECGVSLLMVFLSKTGYREGLLNSIRKLFAIALTGSILGMFLSWLLS